MEVLEPREDILTFDPQYDRASTGKRFVNYLVDIVSFYIAIFGLGILIGIFVPGVITALDDLASYTLLDRLVSLILYAIFMGLVEGMFKGKTLGKLITRTRAVNLDGTPVSFATAFARGFSRAVPFCALSAFGSPSNPWQDRWTNTMVIEE